MSFELIDEKNLIIKCSKYEEACFLHMFCIWSLDYYKNSDGKTGAELKCTANRSNLWKVNAEVTFNFIKSDGTKENTETKLATYQVGNDNSRTTMTTEDTDGSLECLVKVNSFVGFPLKLHDFNKMDDNVNNTALIVEGKKFYVSKQILANASPVFYAMFYSNFKESEAEEIPIQDAKHADFEQFLQLIYGCHNIAWIYNIESLLHLADRFDVQSVMKQCEDHLMLNPRPGYWRNLILAEKYALSRLQDAIIQSLTKSDVKSLCSDNENLGEATIRILAKKLATFVT